MVHFTSTMTRADILQVVGLVDINLFCLWHEQKNDQVNGVIKDSAFEFFVSACTLSAVRGMNYVTGEQSSQTFHQAGADVICGNRELME